MKKLVIRGVAAAIVFALLAGTASVSADGLSTKVYSSTSLPSSVDLSESVYFPVIGDQGEIESCTAWASTYYQFTYEANKYNGIETTPENTYSPAWTYNLIDSGTNTGKNITNAYAVLMRHGALRMKDFPYEKNLADYEFTWSTNIDAMIDALKTRIQEYNNNRIYALTTAENKITSPSSDLLKTVKQYLSNGKMLTVGIDYAGRENNDIMDNWLSKKTTNDEWAVCRAAEADGGHRVTIVGYDDGIMCDINGNGKIESSERGAFKLANSWGTEWANDGFIWVMYDALNIESANSSSTWESNAKGSRTRIFDPIVEGKNTFRYIDVVHHEVNLVGLLTYTTDYRHMNLVHTGRSTGTTPSGSYWANAWSGSNIDQVPYQGTVVVDYGALDDDIENYLSGYNWFVKVQNTASSGAMTNISYKIVDSEGVVVKNFGTIASSIAAGATKTAYRTLNLQYADVDYDGAVTSSDTTFIMNYIVKNLTPSNLQKILSDYNHDGAIDVYDITAINNSLNAAEAAEFAAFLTEEYNRLASTPQTASADMTAEQAQAYAELVTQLYELCILNAA